MKKIVTIISAILVVACTVLSAQSKDSTVVAKIASRLTVGGYGEAAYTYRFYSDSPYRYMYPERYASTPGYGQVDIPHVVVMLGYDFGKGWTMNSEIEFEHGGVEAAMEVEGDEAVELEHEIERGGEVYLEQFWLQKEFNKYAHVRAGMIIVPVGLTNTRHEPDKFFTVYRQEGENTIIPCTWHQIGVSFWGNAGKWKYEAQILPGLNSRLFNNSNWINGGSASPYEYTVANSFAGAFRLDNYSIRNLHLGASAYVGGTNNDAYPRIVNKDGNASSSVSGTVVYGSLDYEYKGKHIVSRGNADFGYLSNAAAIGTSNKNSDNSTFSPYEHTLVGQAAYAAGAEIGVDVLSFGQKHTDKKLFVFGRYEAYDSYIPAEDMQDYKWSDKQRVAVGINYYPIKQIILKAEYSYRFLNSIYNNEPALSIGIAYTGFFNK